ncbi:MAG: protein translocase subunit SecD [Chitinivibrionales bacterium]|nr:protein translocase subunit SecD [Chitinivibrionales bacterium]
MKKVNPVHMILIGVVVIAAAFFLKDSFVYYSKDLQQRRTFAQNDPNIFKRIFNLGLDLQGGMRLVLEIDRSKLSEDAKKDVLDRAYTIIENRINGLGVAEPSIQKQGKDRIIVELPGLSDEQTAKEVLGSTAQLEFKLVREPGELARAVQVIDKAVTGEAEADIAATDTAGVEDTTAIKEKEAQEKAKMLFEGQAEEGDTPSDTTKTAEAGKDEQEPESFSELLVGLENQLGIAEENVAKVKEILVRKDVRDALQRAGLGNSQFLWGYEKIEQEAVTYRQLFFVKARAELKGDRLKDAEATIGRGGMSAGNAIVTLEFDRKGASRFKRVTAANVNKYLAIALDSTIYSAPVIRQKISGGTAQIEGSFSMEEAKILATVLRAGALPAPVTIIEERTVGPSLGADSIRIANVALAIGLILVIIFMVFYYKVAGIIADIALFLNLLFVMAIMAGFNATLTLPGIAGLILIVGMSVDANVIIFERIREELSIGKTVRSAIDAGYSRAFLTIMDANITTLITAVILYYVGTGPIRGFAVTLMAGIVVSLFTALYITRVIFNLITSAPKISKLSI